MRLWKKGDMAKDEKGNVLKFIGLDEDDDYVFEHKEGYISHTYVYYENEDGKLVYVSNTITPDNDKYGGDIQYINPNKYPEYYV
jgi:hypothetical protein